MDKCLPTDVAVGAVGNNGNDTMDTAAGYTINSLPKLMVALDGQRVVDRM